MNKEANCSHQMKTVKCRDDPRRTHPLRTLTHAGILVKQTKKKASVIAFILLVAMIMIVNCQIAVTVRSSLFWWSRFFGGPLSREKSGEAAERIGCSR